MEFPDIIKDVLKGREPIIIEDRDSHHRHGAVLIPLFQANGEYRILFTKRTDKVEEHKGQISFPGGSVDPTDRSFEETALRETQEEIGVLNEDIRILGRTDDTLTVASNFIVHPFVGLIPYPYDFKLNTFEVDRLIKAPLSLFFDKQDNRGEVSYIGVNYHGPTYSFEGDVIWGATARIMENFVDILREKLDLPQKGD